MKTVLHGDRRHPGIDVPLSPKSAERSIPRDVGRWLLLVVSAFVICPVVGIFAALALSATGPFALAALVGVPAALTYFVAARLRVRDRVAIVFAFLSPAVIGGIILAFILYVASQGGFE